MNEYIQDELIENTYLFCAKRIADKEALQDLVCEYAEIIGNTVEKPLLPYVRKDLMSTFIHWDMKMFFQTTCNLLYYGMYESDTVQILEDYGMSGAGLYIVRG